MDSESKQVSDYLKSNSLHYSNHVQEEVSFTVEKGPLLWAMTAMFENTGRWKRAGDRGIFAFTLYFSRDWKYWSFLSLYTSNLGKLKFW